MTMYEHRLILYFKYVDNTESEVSMVNLTNVVVVTVDDSIER